MEWRSAGFSFIIWLTILRIQRSITTLILIFQILKKYFRILQKKNLSKKCFLLNLHGSLIIIKTLPILMQRSPEGTKVLPVVVIAQDSLSMLDPRTILTG